MVYFKNANGEVFAYSSEAEAKEFGPPGLVAMTDAEVRQHLHPVMTDEEMKQSEIQQDKQFLADTDWIIAKMGEASFTGQDPSPLTEQYAEQLKEREMARVRIRLAEGRI